MHWAPMSLGFLTKIDIWSARYSKRWLNKILFPNNTFLPIGSEKYVQTHQQQQDGIKSAMMLRPQVQPVKEAE
jgi:hypothetical protein